MNHSKTDLRYPIGRYEPQPFSEKLKEDWLNDIKFLPQLLENAVINLDESQLLTPYREEGWTVQQVTHHVADSHMQAYLRMRLALTEDWPTITPYNEKLWAELPDARTLPAEVSLEILAPLHRRWVAMLKAMPAKDWERGYQHPERGRTTLLQAAALYEWHSRHHVAHIMELRKSRGW